MHATSSPRGLLLIAAATLFWSLSGMFVRWLPGGRFLRRRSHDSEFLPARLVFSGHGIELYKLPTG